MAEIVLVLYERASERMKGNLTSNVEKQPSQFKSSNREMLCLFKSARLVVDFALYIFANVRILANIMFSRISSSVARIQRAQPDIHFPFPTCT